MSAFSLLTIRAKMRVFRLPLPSLKRRKINERKKLPTLQIYLNITMPTDSLMIGYLTLTSSPGTKREN